MASSATRKLGSSLARRIDRVQMSVADREHAKLALHHAGQLAEVVSALEAGVRRHVANALAVISAIAHSGPASRASPRRAD